MKDIVKDTHRTPRLTAFLRSSWSLGLALVVSWLGSSAVPIPASAQYGAAIGGVGEGQLVSMTATVREVDPRGRQMTLVTPKGDTLMVAIDEKVRDLDQVSPGDVVSVSYYESRLYVIAPPRQDAPEDMRVVNSAQAAPGAPPGAAVAERIILTGLVVDIDRAAKTVSVVDPAGGQVRTYRVQDEENQNMLGMVSVGDTITAYLTHAVAVAVERAE